MWEPLTTSVMFKQAGSGFEQLDASWIAPTITQRLGGLGKLAAANFCGSEIAAGLQSINLWNCSTGASGNQMSTRLEAAFVNSKGEVRLPLKLTSALSTLGQLIQGEFCSSGLDDLCPLPLLPTDVL